MFAYIPARGGSKRVPRKNIRLLDGVPVLGHVVKTLQSLDFISDVYVSTEDAEIARTAEHYGARWLGPRDPSLANDKAGFIDLIHRDIPRHAAASHGDTEALFVLATAALVPAEMYRRAYDAWRKDKPDVLMSSMRYGKSPYWALIPKADGFLEPLFEKMVYINSQDLPPAYTDAGLFYMFDARTLERYDSHKKVDRLQPFLVGEDIAVDVDTEADWAMLEFRYAMQKKGRPS